MVIPTAFVSLSTPMFRQLRTLAKARVVSAGPFHNLVMWGFLVALRTVVPMALLTSVFYEDVSKEGVIVVNVDQVSSPFFKLDNGILTERSIALTVGWAFDSGCNDCEAVGRFGSVWAQRLQ